MKITEENKMPQQRIHEATLIKLRELKIDINSERQERGLKSLTVPDIIEIAVELKTKDNVAAKVYNRGFNSALPAITKKG